MATQHPVIRHNFSRATRARHGGETPTGRARQLLRSGVDMRHDIVRLLIGCLPATTWRRLRCRAVLLAMLVLPASPLHAQPRQAATPEAGNTPAPAQPLADQRLTLGACTASHSTPSQITFYDEHHSLLYRLTDRGLRRSRDPQMAIVGGLVPTTIIAAQPDNAIKAAIAWQLPGPIGSTPFAPQKRRTVWVSSFSTGCEKP
jgi:hypothetical protein